MTESLYSQAINFVYYSNDTELAAVSVEVAKSNPSVFLRAIQAVKQLQTHSTVDQTIEMLIKDFKPIDAIKLHRKTYNSSLCEAKNVVDAIRDRLGV
jgi:ribosomal protein L7/L12